MFYYLNQFKKRGHRSFFGKTKEFLLPLIVSVFVLHVIAMMLLEGLSFGDSIWLTAITITTVGYGDVSAATPLGRGATLVFAFIGIFTLGSWVSKVSEKRAEARIRKLNGRWRWNLENHVLVISTLGTETDDFYMGLIREMRHMPAFASPIDCPVQILTSAFPDGIPDRIRELGVVYTRSTGSIEADLVETNARMARGIVVLGDNRDVRSDALVFDVVSRIESDAFVVAECVDDKSRPRFNKVGADAIVRPARGYPEMLARALTDPGTEQVMEEIFCGSGKTIVGVALDELTSLDFADLSAKLQQQNIGLLVAIERGGVMQMGPFAGVVDADRVIILALANVSHEAVRSLVRK